MHKYIVIITLFALMPLCPAKAQGVGYQGQRLLPYYNFTGTIDWFDLVSEFGFTSIRQLRFHHRHEVGLDAVVTRNSMVGVEYNNYNLNTTDPFFGFPYQLRANTLAATFTTHAAFEDNTLAPVGNYMKAKVGYGTVNFHDSLGQAISPGYVGPPIISEIKYDVVNLGVAFGNRRVMYKHLVINFGLSMDFFARINNTTEMVIFDESLGPRPEDLTALARYSWNNLQGTFILGYTVGVGGLLW